MDASTWQPSKPRLREALAEMKRKRKRNEKLIEYADALEEAIAINAHGQVRALLYEIFDPFRESE